MKKITLCATVVPEKYDTSLKYLSPAANRFQINLCNEMIKQGCEFNVLSYIAIPITKDYVEVIEKETTLLGSTGYIFKNSGLLKSILRYNQMLRKKISDSDVVMAYNVTYAWLLTPFLSKNKKSVLILADISEPNSYKELWKKIYARIQIISIRKYDCVIGLSSNTKRLLRKKQNFICLEGGIKEEIYNKYITCKQREQEIKIMYAGVLEKVTGIDLLLEAVHMIDNENIKLIISGKGSLEGLVEQYQFKDERIQYLGYLDYNNYLEALDNADILVNPRNMNLSENQNNFPSKIMEYLATGKQIISTKFPGYENYEGYIDFCDCDVEDIRRTILVTLTSDNNMIKGIFNRNREFSKKYLWKNQIGRILDLIDQ